MLRGAVLLAVLWYDTLFAAGEKDKPCDVEGCTEYTSRCCGMEATAS